MSYIDNPGDFPFTEDSEEKLKKLNPDLANVLREAKEITDLNFQIVEGKRSASTQEKMWYKGEAPEDSMSAHRIGHAVKVVVYLDGQVCFNWNIYAELASCIRYAAQNVNVGISWSTLTTDLRFAKDDNLIELVDRAVKSATHVDATFMFIPNHFELVLE